MELSISNVINVSVSQAQTGLGEYNTSNLALFTTETAGGGFGSDGYKIYLEPTEVGDDFGTDSQTYAMAVAVFSQNPNILANGGYLVVILMTTEVQHFALSGVPASGSFTLAYDEGTTAAINWNDTASAIQTKLRAIPGFEEVTVSGSLSSQSLNISYAGVYGNLSLPTVGGSGLQTSAPAAITITPSQTTAGETIGAAITRTEDEVQYFGIITQGLINQTDELAAAAIVQALNKIIFFVSNDSASVEEGGLLDLLRSGNFTQSRGLFYGSDTVLEALQMMSAYAGRGLSTNFNGSNTTQTMHLKDLVTIQPDPSMTQTLLNKCIDAGADSYPSIQGVAKVFCSGKNSFFDQIYNLRWFVGAIQIAGFNALAESSTKIPQTEDGVNILKSAYRKVCEQGKTNQYIAPGEWNNPTTFGNIENFYANIREQGYYIYSQPIAQQSQASRVARQAPLIQIAIKEAGAIQSSDVIIYVNP